MRALAIVLVLTGTAAAQQSPSSKETPSEDDAVRRELNELRARQRWLERRIEAGEARAAAPAAAAVAPLPPPPPPPDTTPRFHFGRDGFVFGTADGKSEIRLRLVLHIDGRAYFATVQPIADTFLIRRARPFIEGTLFGVIDYRLMPDFALGQATLLDAYVELHPWKWLRLRGGRFRIPIGLEWLQSDSTIALAERSLASDLVPYRDLGVMLSGSVAEDTFCYALAVFNGAPDGGNGPDLDSQSDKDYVGRVFLRPFRPTKKPALMSLGVGVAGSYGTVKGTATASNLPSYRSPGQQPIFSYLASNAIAPDAAVAAGARWRVSPQFYWYVGPVGLLAEYVLSSQRVQRADAVADLQHRAWNVTASFVMTLEHASYEGVVPSHPVDFRHRNFGAFELTLRYSELRIDEAAFPNFADPATSVRSARELAAGLNWYLTEHTRIMLSFHRTDYAGGAPMDGDRDAENAFIGRLQLTL